MRLIFPTYHSFLGSLGLLLTEREEAICSNNDESSEWFSESDEEKEQVSPLTPSTNAIQDIGRVLEHRRSSLKFEEDEIPALHLFGR